MVCDCLPSLIQIIFTLVTFYILKFAYNLYKAQSSDSKSTTVKIQKEDWKKDVVYLYQFPRPNYVPQFSPFCLKVEAFLRLHGIKYEIVSTFSSRSKNGLLPFIELNGEQIADSQFIIFHLKRHFNIEDNLTDEQKAIERAFERMLDSSLLNSAIWFKVKETTAFAGALLELRFGKSMNFLKYLLAPYLKINLLNRFKIEGTGKHSDEEVLTILRKDLQAIENYIGEKEFFFGDKPTLIDVLLFSYIASTVYMPYHHKSTAMIESEFPKILKQVKKIEKKFFGEFKFGH